jgi:hypothetical protein
MVVRKGKSVYALWRELKEMGSDVSYSQFLRWVEWVSEEAVEKGYLVIGRGVKRKRLFKIRDVDGLLRLLKEKGYVV